MTYFWQHRVSDVETRRNMHLHIHLKRSMSKFDLRSRSHEVKCRAKYAILHISRCVFQRETHWAHPQRSVSTLSKVKCKKKRM